ncbi:MAG: glycosyltransferase [Planctomycetaceae bacterium]|nr:glycosyltransferase [Planctomycetales bacterium]MCB9872901.1 glycosyltransferase [Planctomycetaceae bacterium]MCB9941477.1 glycosyltransferase [Planctomycetaceae bacterium]
MLQLAYACSPWRGSEPGVGWHRAVEAARYSDIWVICEGVEFEHQVLGHLENVGAIDGLNFRFVCKSRFEQILSRIPGFYYLAYRLWHRRAFQVAAALHKEVNFDLVHQSNLCGYREPGKLGSLNVPLVWGPIGGTQNHPWIAIGQAGMWGGIQETVRSVANSLQLRFSWRVRRAAKLANVLLAANATNQADIERMFGKRVPVLCEIGSPNIGPTRIRQRTSATDVKEPLRVLWVGNLHAFKALPLLLEALAMLPSSAHVRLRVIGDGPQRKRWQRIAERLGVADRVEWVGRVQDLEMQSHYSWADVFVFTSLRDTTGTVVLEALASGVPVLAADHQGVGGIVTPECGMKVAVAAPSEMSKQYRDAIVAILEDESLLKQLSAGALRRAADYAWSEQGKRMRDYYRQVLGDQFDWDGRVESEQPSMTETLM